MATPGDYLDEADLKAIAAGGFVNEDLMQKIQDSSEGIKPVFLPMLPTVPVKNSYKEWNEDELDAPSDSSVISGSDATVANQTMPNAKRLGNHCQTNIKVVAASTRARNVDAVTSDPLEYRTRRKMLELRRDQEWRSLGNQASVADNGNNTKGVTAGMGAWIKTHRYSGTGGAAGGFNTSTKVVDTITPGEGRKLTVALVRTAVQDIYEEGAGENGLVIMSTPTIIKGLSQALRADSTFNFVQPTANISGTQATTQVAQGWTDKAITDFGVTLSLVANRLQPTYASGDGTPKTVANVFIFDMNYLARGHLQDVKVEPLAKVGLSDRRQLSVDWMTICLLERAQACIGDIDPTLAVTAT